jgi:hypothetical protein
VLWPSPGGHTRTAIAIAEALRGRGHTIEFVVDATAGSDDLIRASGFPVHRDLSVYSTPLRPSFRASFRSLVERTGCDAIHWFEKRAGIRGAAAAARDAGRSFVWTVTSGGPPDEYYGLNRVAVYTPEVAQHAARRSPGTTVHVLPARISVTEIDRALDSRSRGDIRAQFKIPDTSLLIVRVARCARVYVPSIKLGLGLTEHLNDSGRPAVFVHAGFVNEPEAATEIRSLVDAANRRAGRSIAFSETNPLAGVRYLAAADVCVASGRSAIEALALGRPTIVAWGSQCLGLVEPGNIDEIARTNFQGRLATAPPSGKETTAAGIARILQHDFQGDEQQARVFCSQFVRSRYSVEKAAEAYEALYEDRRVTLDSAARYYSNPRNVATELRGWIPIGVRRSIRRLKT